MFLFSVLDLFLQILSKKYIWRFDVTWLISQQFICIGLKPAAFLVQKRNRPQKCPFIATNNWILLAAWWSVKYFFLQIPRYSGKVLEKKRWWKQTNAKCLTFQVIAINYTNLCFWISRVSLWDKICSLIFLTFWKRICLGILV